MRKGFDGVGWAILYASILVDKELQRSPPMPVHECYMLLMVVNVDSFPVDDLYSSLKWQFDCHLWHLFPFISFSDFHVRFLSATRASLCRYLEYLIFTKLLYK
jgi:hypothetical protein